MGIVYFLQTFQGEIVLLRELDRESTTEHSFNIQASVEGKHISTFALVYKISLPWCSATFAPGLYLGTNERFSFFMPHVFSHR